MAKMATSEEQLSAMITSALSGAVNYVCDKILDTLTQKMFSMGIGMGEYATGEFNNAWRQDALTVLKSSVESQISYHWEDLTLDQPNFIHGSAWDGYSSDVRKGLADIIFNGKAGDLFGEGYWTVPRDVWGEMIDEVGLSFNKWFAEGMKLSGINVSAIGGVSFG